MKDDYGRIEALIRNSESDERAIAGVDEAGAGALAGPVAAGAVILGRDRDWSFLRDSKTLTSRKRREFASEILKYAKACATAFVPHSVIDDINILNARLLAMKIAVIMLSKPPDIALFDGNRIPADSPAGSHAIIGGDNLVPEISAASILAKVARDEYMGRVAEEYKDYGFELHFGYATKVHKDALEKHGPCAIHRKTYAPVRESERNGLPLELPFDLADASDPLTAEQQLSP